jgi:5'-3' exonuclease
VRKINTKHDSHFVWSANGQIHSARLLIMNSDLPILLIDGRNLLYRAIYANLANKSRGKHHFVVMMRFMRQLLELDPSAVMIFWDAPKNTLWRKKL